MRRHSIRPTFVDIIPEDIEEGVLYVCIQYGTAIHRCCCGCGREVVTPLSPVDWQLTRDLDHASLFPSIGNWSFPCQAHYWIRRNAVVWAPRWTKRQIVAGRAVDAKLRDRYFNEEQGEHVAAGDASEYPPKMSDGILALITRLTKWFT